MKKYKLVFGNFTSACCGNDVHCETFIDSTIQSFAKHRIGVHSILQASTHSSRAKGASDQMR